MRVSTIRIKVVFFDGGELKGLMQKAKMAVEELAERSGLDVATMEKIIAGEQGVPKAWAMRLAEALETHFVDLCGNAFE